MKKKKRAAATTAAGRKAAKQWMPMAKWASGYVAVGVVGVMAGAFFSARCERQAARLGLEILEQAGVTVGMSPTLDEYRRWENGIAQQGGKNSRTAAFFADYLQSSNDTVRKPAAMAAMLASGGQPMETLMRDLLGPNQNTETGRQMCNALMSAHLDDGTAASLAQEGARNAGTRSTVLGACTFVWGERGNPADAGAFLNKELLSKDDAHRSDARRAISMLADRKSRIDFGPMVATMTDALTSYDENAMDPVDALQTLAALKDRAHASAPTVQKLLNDREFEVRAAAVTALIAIAPESPEVLAKLTRNWKHRSREVRMQTMRDIASLGTHAQELLPEALHRLKARHLSTDEFVTMMTMAYQVSSHDGATVGALKEILQERTAREKSNPRLAELAKMLDGQH